MLGGLAFKKWTCGVFLILLGNYSISARAMAQNIASSEDKEQIWTTLSQRQTELNLCAFEFDRARSRQSSLVYAIAEQKYLVELLCFMGAYQGNYEYYFIETNHADLRVFPLTFGVFYPDSSGEWQRGETREIVGLPNFAPETQILSVYAKDNGVGTCGSWARYKFNRDRFQLVEYLAKPECDDNYIKPQNYPQIYPRSRL